MTKIDTIVSLDVGEKRVGVAMANTLARLASPLTTLLRGDDFWEQLQHILQREAVTHLVVGLPRNLSGVETAQTLATRHFADELRTRFAMPVTLQDEALTSRQAESELRRRGKPYEKGDIDALAATYILEDYLRTEEPHA